jgi:hypothetical protein
VCCREETRTAWKVEGPLQFEAGTASGQIDNVTVNRHRLRAKKDLPDPRNETPGGHAKPAPFVRPVHLSFKIESLNLYGPLITDPLRRRDYYPTEFTEYSPPVEFHLRWALFPINRANPQ